MDFIPFSVFFPCTCKIMDQYNIYIYIYIYIYVCMYILFLAAHSDSIVGYNFVVISCMFLVAY